MECRKLECSSRSSWDVSETVAEATEAIQAPRLQIIHLLLTPHRPCVTRADLRKYVVTIVCSACLTLLHTERHQNFARKNVEIGLANKWSTILKVSNVCKLTNANETQKLRLVRTRHRSRENEGEFAPQERQDVEMRLRHWICVCEAWIGRCSRQ